MTGGFICCKLWLECHTARSFGPNATDVDTMARSNVAILLPVGEPLRAADFPLAKQTLYRPKRSCLH